MPSYTMALRRSLGVELGIFLSRLILVLSIKSDRGSPGFWPRKSREEVGSSEPQGRVNMYQA